MKTTVTVKEDLLVRIKQDAVEEGESLDDAVNRLLRKALLQNGHARPDQKKAASQGTGVPQHNVDEFVRDFGEGPLYKEGRTASEYLAILDEMEFLEKLKRE